ncbi:MAG TPA: bifunctional phosphoribosyl-AMP cyclohydrolase/phosphoribosyl-ATP diphosphatase HisIE [Candidatus Methylomirabilis sp.]|jgi:phosphoribosyl-ATP pyrophosphohydrolase/phosphoribosyl-AMP cyclohydrolase|nr:bifunctional phosphoribosyl-AMP cyclohydrolase/phosphoribosyl-ATP diphosphatase HisIE [Candidatus Methylomirabilis sp.]
MDELLATLTFDAQGLIPAVIQDDANGDVLMVAYMNREALEKTLRSGLTHFYSRSRRRIWQKGETSGHIQRVRSVHLDCDADALLLRVEQVVAACHTGNRSCFFTRLKPDGLRTEEGELRFDPAVVYGGLPAVLQRVFATVRGRKAAAPPGSYVGDLFAAGRERILKKIGEETTELLLAAQGGEREAIRYEVADLWFHTLVLLAECGLTLEEVAGELARREGKRKPEYGPPEGG